MDSEQTVTEEEDSYMMDEPGARTEVVYKPSDDSDEDIYTGGINNDFHTCPKYTPENSIMSESEEAE